MSGRSLLKYTKLPTPGAGKYTEKLLVIEPIPQIRIYGPYRCKPFQILEKAIKLSSTLWSPLFQEILFKIFWLQLRYTCICSIIWCNENSWWAVWSPQYFLEFSPSSQPCISQYQKDSFIWMSSTYPINCLLTWD